jgi:predicted permease
VDETRGIRYSIVAVFAIKALHTLIFLSVLSAIGWLVVTGWRGRRDRTVAVAAALVAGEAAIFVANRGVCPLTPLAQRYGARRGSVSDIFLPRPVARTIPIWSSALVVLGLVLHALSLARSRTGRHSAELLSGCE